MIGVSLFSEQSQRGNISNGINWRLSISGAIPGAQHQKAKNILLENREKLDELAKYLYEKETITGEEFMRILGQEGKAQ